jgi:beta-1,4-mannosyltransferase
MRVAFIPVWKENPYHANLAAALETVGTTLLSPASLKALCQDVTSGRETIDLLHIHALPYFSLHPKGLTRFLLFYRRLARLRRAGVRLVWTVHDFQNHDSPYWRVEDLVNRRLARQLDALIVHGPTAKEVITTRWPQLDATRVHVIPHGNFIGSYPNQCSRAEARNSLALPADALVYLFLGLIRPYKGVLQMVDAFQATAGSNTRLIIAGKPVTEQIRREVEHATCQDNRITFLPGRVADHDIQVYMNACDLVVLPYKRIFTSGAAILAMSFGKPCLAPRDGCVVDALDDRGALFFDTSHETSLAGTFLNSISRSSEFPRMGNHNLARAAVWTWESVAQMTHAVYKTACDSHPPSMPAQPR